MPKAHVLMSAAMLAATGLAAPAGAASAPLAGLAGHWRVAGVAVADSGIQALADNDPSLMGKRLSFTPARLAWERSTATNDTCAQPRFERLDRAPSTDLGPQLRKLGMPHPTAYAVRCRSGNWGPDGNAMLFVGRGGTIAMPWYDGGLLKLVR